MLVNLTRLETPPKHKRNPSSNKPLDDDMQDPDFTQALKKLILSQAFNRSSEVGANIKYSRAPPPNITVLHETGAGEFKKQLIKKQYVEVVREEGNLDKLKGHHKIINEVFTTNDAQLDQ